MTQTSCDERTQALGQALVRAAERGRPLAECLELIEAGADLACTGFKGLTAMHHAARNGYTDLCVALALHGADVDALDATTNVYSPLMEAAMRQYTQTTLALVALGATISEFSMQVGHLCEYDRTQLDRVRALPPLHAAVASGRPELVMHLLDKGLDPGQPGPDGCSLEQTATQWRQEPMLDVLRSWSARRVAIQALDEAASPTCTPARTVGA